MGGMFGWGGAKGWSAEKPVFSPQPERFWPKPNRYCNVTDPYAGNFQFIFEIFSQMLYGKTAFDQFVVIEIEQN